MARWICFWRKIKNSHKWVLFNIGARGRTWTGTRVKSRRILSPVRLPIPPLGQALVLNKTISLYSKNIYYASFFSNYNWHLIFSYAIIYLLLKNNWRNTQVRLKGLVLKTRRSRKRRRGSNPFSSAILVIAG